MGIEIIKAGVFTTIQDGGRYDYLDFGVPVSGFMDVYSATIANTLVGNHPEEALLEITTIGPTIRFDVDVSIAITGASMQTTLNDVVIANYKVIQVKKGDLLKMGIAAQGVRAYLAFAGGIDVPEVFGSKATYTYAKIGGFNGRALQKGDFVKLNAKIVKEDNHHYKQLIYPNTLKLNCTPGPEWHWFSAAMQQYILSTEFVVGVDSNRMGYRLEGGKVVLPNVKEIISSPIVKGVVQITSSGQPIIMMADAPTTGGYVRMLNVSSVSCNRLAQLPIHGKVRFEM